MKKEIILKTANQKDYLSVDEAADYLNVKASAIRNYLYLGKFPTYKFKAQTLLSLKDVVKWKKTKQG